MSDTIIDIKSEDIVDNLKNILENSNILKTSHDIDSLKCIIFYLDDNTVSNYQKNKIEIHNNRISKTEMMKLILENRTNNSKKYDLTGIYKFDVNLQEDRITDFAENPDNFSFLKRYNTIQEITFNPCIELFNDSSAVVLIFTKKHNTTDKVEHNKHTRKIKKVNFDIENLDKTRGKTSKKYD